MVGGHLIIFVFVAIRGTVAFGNSFDGGPASVDPEPQFADVIPNITVVAGNDVALPCVVDSLGKYKVAWIQPDLRILLTLQNRVITRNPRITITHDNFRTWSLQIQDVRESDSGNYVCQVNTSPMKHIVGNVQVVETEPPPKDPGPQFADVLPNITAVAGSDVTLPCVVDSLGKYRVAWVREDNRNILTIGPHVITRNPRITITHHNFRTWSLQIQNVSESDSGNYWCQINTVPMKILIGNLQVVDPEPPNKDSEPKFGDVIPNITVVVGRDATLPCVVDSQGKYNVAWIHMDRQVLLTVNDRVVARNPRVKITHDNSRTWSLQIQNVSESDSGNYICQVNTVPMKHLVGNIRVVVTPKIRIPNQRVGAAIGTDVTLVCNLESNPKSVTYWTRDGGSLMIISNAKYSSSLSDTGMHKVQMSLTIKNLCPADYGYYTCVAKNSAGEAEGSITIYETESPPKDLEPQFADVIPNITAVAGSDVTLPCAVDSLGQYKVAWIQENNHNILTISYHVITGDPRITITHDRFRTWSLHIQNVRESDSGNYWCQINTVPMKHIVGSIQVVEPPQPQFGDVIPNITVVAGSDATLPCVVDSLGKYNVAWIKMDRDLLLTINDKVVGRKTRFTTTHDNSRTWSLRIQNVSQSDSGNYMCLVNTDPMKHIVGNIQVVEPPHKDSEPKFGDVIPNITVVVGRDAMLPCVVDSQRKYNVAWIKMDRQVLLTVNDRVITRDPRIKITHDNFRTWSLQILNVSESDSGNYMCQLNADRMKQLVGNIQVVATPIIRIPQPLVGAAIGTDVTLVCNLESNPKSVTYWTRDGGGLMIISSSKYSSSLTDTGMHKVQMSLTIKNLHPDDYVYYTCVAKNSAGEAEGSITIYEITPTYPSSDDLASSTAENRMQDLENGDLENIDTPPPVDVVSGSNKGGGEGRWMWTILRPIVLCLIFCL